MVGICEVVWVSEAVGVSRDSDMVVVGVMGAVSVLVVVGDVVVVGVGHE